jgi:hypothetical protein
VPEPEPEPEPADKRRRLISSIAQEGFFAQDVTHRVQRLARRNANVERMSASQQGGLLDERAGSCGTGARGRL